MATRVPITIRLESFEGPLDLLLYLIQSHEMEVSHISVSKVTDQYLAYVQLMQDLDFDVASEFLVLAATLLHWKSRSLLPKDETAQDLVAENDLPLTEEDLIRQLLEHQRFKKAGAQLAQLPRLGEDIFAREAVKLPIERIWKEMNVTALTLSYQDMLARSRKRKTILKKETVSLRAKIEEFAARLDVGVPTALSKLVHDLHERPEVVVTFLASLEMARLKKMKLYQEGTYQEIYLELIESLLEFDLNLAEDFENMNRPLTTAIGATPLEQQVSL